MPPPNAHEQTLEGDYWEEIEGILTAAEDHVTSGDLTNREAVSVFVEAAAAASHYASDDDMAVVCLKYSHHPTAYFFEHGGPQDNEARLEQLCGRPAIAWNAGKRAFPFQLFACEAMEADIKEKLASSKLVAALPAYEPENADGEEEGGGAGPEETQG